MTEAALQDWTVDTVARSFSKAADSYDSAARLQRIVGLQLFNTVQVDIKPGLTILDVGSGTGYCTELLARSGTRVIALDLALNMLRQTRARLGERVDYVSADTQFIPIKDKSCDIVFANLVLQWCPDLPRAFLEFKRILKPGGRVFFSTLGPQTLKELRRAWQVADTYRHVNDFLTQGAIQSQIDRSGLDGNCQSSMMQLTYDSPIHLMREIKTLGAVNMSENRQRGLMGKHKLQTVCAEYNKLICEKPTYASWEIVVGHLQVHD